MNQDQLQSSMECNMHKSKRTTSTRTVCPNEL